MYTFGLARDMPHIMMTQVRVGIQGVMYLDNLNLVLAPWSGYVNCFSEHLATINKEVWQEGSPSHLFRLVSVSIIRHWFFERFCQ